MLMRKTTSRSLRSTQAPFTLTTKHASTAALVRIRFFGDPGELGANGFDGYAAGGHEFRLALALRSFKRTLIL